MTSARIALERVTPEKAGFLVRMLEKFLAYIKRLRIENKQREELFRKYLARKETIEKSSLTMDEQERELAKIDEEMRYPIAMKMQDEVEVLLKQQEEFKAQGLEDVEVNIIKEESRMLKYAKKSQISIDEFFETIMFFGHDWEQTNRLLAGKKVRFKGKQFTIVKFKVVGKDYHLVIQEFGDHWFTIEDEASFRAFLETRLVSMEKGKVETGDVFAAEVASFIEKNKADPQMMQRLREITIVKNKHRVKIDGYHEMHVHIYGYPEHIWIPVKTGAIERAAVVLRAVQVLDHMLASIDAASRPFGINSLAYIAKKERPDGTKIDKRMFKGFLEALELALENKGQQLSKAQVKIFEIVYEYFAYR